MENAITVKNLVKKYNDFTLDNVNLTLPTGSIMGFIGENGAGKSTTIKLILDLIRRDGGEISVLGKDLKTDNKEIKEHIGVVMDESCFSEYLSITDINKILKTIYKTWNEKAFLEYTNRFSLTPNKKIKEYSRGMKMKLSIAVALSHDSKLLILDEATSGLDPVVRDEILDVFLDFIQDETHSILISSHIISDLEKICDYITFIHKGKIIFSESKDVLLEKYGVLKCTEQELDFISKDAIKGVRKNSFGVEALVEKSKVDLNSTVDRATIEDIMLFFTRERMI